MNANSAPVPSVVNIPPPSRPTADAQDGAWEAAPEDDVNRIALPDAALPSSEEVERAMNRLSRTRQNHRHTKAVTRDRRSSNSRTARRMRDAAAIVINEEDGDAIEALIKDMIHRLKSHLGEHTAAYKELFHYNGTFRMDRSFQLMFLRAASYRPEQAVTLMVRHFELKKLLWGDSKLVRRIEIRDFDEAEQEVLLDGELMRALPFTDNYGRTVLFGTGNEQNCGRIADPKRFNSRLLWFFAMSAVETHTACQKQGIVYANYSAQSNLASTDRERYWEICKVFNAVPVRFEAMYFGYHHDNMKSLSDLMEYGLMDSSRHGMNVMIGDPIKFALYLEDHGITTRALLDAKDPAKSSKRDHSRWVKRRKRIEKSPAMFTDTMEYITTHDVIYAKGMCYRNLPGNVRLRSMVQVQVTNYHKACQSLKMRDEFITNFIEAVKATPEPMRFLTTSAKEGGKDGFWEEMEPSLVQTKILNLFNYRISKSKHHQRAEAPPISPKDTYIKNRMHRMAGRVVPRDRKAVGAAPLVAGSRT